MPAQLIDTRAFVDSLSLPSNHSLPASICSGYTVHSCYLQGFDSDLLFPHTCCKGRIICLCVRINGQGLFVRPAMPDLQKNFYKLLIDHHITNTKSKFIRKKQGFHACNINLK
ncbi:hypothetical protein BpHYR1_012716 [Brachionus plicatilis]|uniref:Uncharacterized protein n=1 Tax=Brachionus plicatilis TaxID=10195 RepID=A0A3M7QA57_BRAPC|nr:hypothetical protein BpHYR1_012716 [Brachionus plicatilis]